MQTSNFFRINLPYGLRKNAKNEWVVFNREYMPLGYNGKTSHNILDETTYEDLPIFTRYTGVTEAFLQSMADRITKDKDGSIKTIYLYSEENNPVMDKNGWDVYAEKVRALSMLKVLSNKSHYRKPVSIL